MAGYVVIIARFSAAASPPCDRRWREPFGVAMHAQSGHPLRRAGVLRLHHPAWRYWSIMRSLIDCTVDISLDSRLLQRRDPEARLYAIVSALFARRNRIRLISDKFWYKKNFNLLSFQLSDYIIKKVKIVEWHFRRRKINYSWNKFLKLKITHIQNEILSLHSINSKY